MFSPAGWNTFDYFPAVPANPADPAGDGLSWTVYIDVHTQGTRMYIWKPHTTQFQGPNPYWTGGGWHHLSTLQLFDAGNQPAGATTVLTAISV
jgi:hypothetical protein